MDNLKPSGRAELLKAMLSVGLMGLAFTGYILIVRIFTARAPFLLDFIPIPFCLALGAFSHLILGKRLLPWPAILLLIFILVVLDLSSKTIVLRLIHEENPLKIIDNWLLLRPWLNTKGSMIGAHIGMKIPGTSVLIFLSLIFVPLVFYRLPRKAMGTDRATARLSLAFLVGGIICSLLDDVLHKGSWDFLLINGICVFDFKDVYLSLGLCLFILSVIRGRKLVTALDSLKRAKSLPWLRSEWKGVQSAIIKTGKTALDRRTIRTPDRHDNGELPSPRADGRLH